MLRNTLPRPLLLPLWLFCLACLFGLGAPAGAVAGTVRPPEALQDTTLAALVQRLEDIVSRHDQTGLLALVHAQCRVSYGGFQGPDDFRDYWFGAASHGRDVFAELRKALDLGGAVDGNGDFVLPYTSLAPGMDGDGVMLGVVTGPAVNVRAWPGLKGRLVGTVGHETVRLCNIEVPIAVDGLRWSCILLPDGTRGYVADDFLVRPTGIRFLFQRMQGRWMLLSTVAGE